MHMLNGNGSFADEYAILALTNEMQTKRKRNTNKTQTKCKRNANETQTKCKRNAQIEHLNVCSTVCVCVSHVHCSSDCGLEKWHAILNIKEKLVWYTDFQRYVLCLLIVLQYAVRQTLHTDLCIHIA
jgi:hypothetical protein